MKYHRIDNYKIFLTFVSRTTHQIHTNIFLHKLTNIANYHAISTKHFSYSIVLAHPFNAWSYTFHNTHAYAHLLYMPICILCVLHHTNSFIICIITCISQYSCICIYTVQASMHFMFLSTSINLFFKTIFENSFCLSENLKTETFIS